MMTNLKLIYWKIRFFFEKLFNIKHDIELIPKGTMYCYNEEVCPYFVSLGGYVSACKFEKYVGWNMSHWDQCKMCGIWDYDVKLSKALLVELSAIYCVHNTTLDIRILNILPQITNDSTHEMILNILYKELEKENNVSSVYSKFLNNVIKYYGKENN